MTDAFRGALVGAAVASPPPTVTFPGSRRWVRTPHSPHSRFSRWVSRASSLPQQPEKPGASGGQRPAATEHAVASVKTTGDSGRRTQPGSSSFSYPHSHEMGCRRLSLRAEEARGEKTTKPTSDASGEAPSASLPAPKPASSTDAFVDLSRGTRTAPGDGAGHEPRYAMGGRASRL